MIEDTMSENIAQTVQKAIQDLVAPDLRELKASVAANQKQNDQQFAALQKEVHQRFDAVDQRFDAQNQMMDAQFKAMMAALAGVKAQNNLYTIQTISALSEGVAIPESRHQ